MSNLFTVEQWLMQRKEVTLMFDGDDFFAVITIAGQTYQGRGSLIEDALNYLENILQDIRWNDN